MWEPECLLRKAIDGEVIIRTGRRIAGVRPIAGVHAPVSVVRMAVGDAYGAKEWRTIEEGQEVAYRTERISRSVCTSVAEFAFLHARRLGAKVFGGPKFTVSPIYESLLKGNGRRRRALPRCGIRAAAESTLPMPYCSPPRAVWLFSALNRDGDCLSDLVLQMFGSIAGSESLVLSFDDQFRPLTVMAEAPHGAAPGLLGKNVANPMAMILAGASLLSFIPDPRAELVARAITGAVFSIVRIGSAPPTWVATLSTSAFTDAVIGRVRGALLQRAKGRKPRHDGLTRAGPGGGILGFRRPWRG